MKGENKQKKRLSYQWRLFWPVVTVLWVLLLGLAFWQYHRTETATENYVEQNLKLVNSRLNYLININEWDRVETFNNFIHEYYEEDPMFEDIRITIFDRDWIPLKSQGVPIQLKQEEKDMLPENMFHRKVISPIPYGRKYKENYYLLSEVKTPENAVYYVASSLPKDDTLSESMTGSNFSATWIIVFIIATTLTLITFFSTRYLGRSIGLLRDFANRSANDPNFIPGDEFTHDELGDIAKQIVHIYKERAIARERTEREHQLALHAIEDKARQKRQMTNNINHELKTPISVIKGYLDTILDSPDMDAETGRHFLVKAREHANRLVNLIADVSAITRLEEGENQINTEQLDFHEIVYVFANDSRESGILGHFNIEIEIPLATDILGNGNLLMGMLSNLTKNAVNYSGGDTIRIEYKGEDDNFYKFSFYDNGHGVPESSIEHLFDRFYRIDSGRARKSGGTGLGLPIVFNTIKAHGGVITVQNRAEGGLEFIFTLRKWHSMGSTSNT